MKVTKAEPLVTRCRTEGAEGNTVFGIWLVWANGRQVVCEDLCDCRSDAERLCRLLLREDVEPENCAGLFEDFAAEPAGTANK